MPNGLNPEAFTKTIQNIGGDLVFCPLCDYAIPKLERDSTAKRLDPVLCPRCNGADLTMFYSFGSQKHRERLDALERGEVKGNPFPMVP